MSVHTSSLVGRSVDLAHQSATTAQAHADAFDPLQLSGLSHVVTVMFKAA
eukprot:CAMPEP_0177548692 /NCGR_PEP_ID=MMETSP0369-20130122/64604_1 /TAXON_ID=447022 ORGANISM="Scrippsiella hangoei-like, Strain SHHI-4" /NCGR_SAMPLE_ID=MMETSP0369 /ASSEMBLY_ACC=CAM_ASM_000364 /LENGTH=49 /DNA_ID=CAMNT_0019033703 /DNA_START=291 /DNA_END=440 /DNA_ORIENTATION=-